MKYIDDIMALKGVKTEVLANEAGTGYGYKFENVPAERRDEIRLEFGKRRGRSTALIVHYTDGVVDSL